MRKQENPEIRKLDLERAIIQVHADFGREIRKLEARIRELENNN